ncbi:AAA family ATPase [Streptomyces virginiae]
MALKEEVDRLAQPPAGFGVFLQANEDGTVDIFTGGRKLRVNVSPSVDPEDLRRGQEVMLNEALNVVEAMEFERAGDIVTLKEILEDGERALVVGHTDEERVVRLAEPLLDITIRPGDALLLEPRSGYVYEVVPKSEVEDLVLEEVPDIDYDKIGGLGDQIELIRDAVELPYLYPDLFKEHELRPPKGILLYGPPGCGKTLIAKAVANSLAKKVAEVTGQAQGKSYFLNIKGPELLNKYVGETEKNLERIFTEASAVNAVLLFDEADAIFGKRSDVKDSHDKHANMESAYLLQRMESFDGIAILTTNLRANLDEAFTRRLDVIADFPVPDATQRRALWERCLGDRLPRADDVDLGFCADRFELAGGSIRSCAVTAAYFAAAAGGPLTMRQVMTAVAQEYRKLGHLVLEGEFGPYLGQVTDA